LTVRVRLPVFEGAIAFAASHSRAPPAL